MMSFAMKVVVISLLSCGPFAFAKTPDRSTPAPGENSVPVGMINLPGYEMVEKSEGENILRLGEGQLRERVWNCGETAPRAFLPLEYYGNRYEIWGAHWRVIRSTVTSPQIVISKTFTPYSQLAPDRNPYDYRQRNFYLTLDSSLQTITSVRVDTLGFDRAVLVNIGTVVEPRMVEMIRPGSVFTESCRRM